MADFEAQRRTVSGPGSRLHDLGTSPRFRDRISDYIAFFGHRFDNCDRHHGDGHDDDAADGYRAAIEDNVLCFDRWLAHAGG